MVRPLAFVCLLSALVGAGETAPVFFREPDRETRREIDDLVGKGLGNASRDKRREARDRLAEIGPWAVDALGRALLKRTESPTVRWNAALVLARIPFGTCREHLQAAVDGDAHPDVVRASCLALGLFRDARDVDVLERRLLAGEPAAALALAKLRDPRARRVLATAARDLPRDGHLAAAILLAATVADPATDAARHLTHEDRLVRKTAATCLLVRPPLDPKLVRDRLDGRHREKDESVRALLCHVLGGFAGSGDVRALLLEASTKSREKKEARIAALISLAREWGVKEHYTPLKRALRAVRSRGDPVAGPLIFALARTGHPDAIEDLERIVESRERGRTFYAAGSLVHVAAHHDLPEWRAILQRVSDSRDLDPALEALADTLKYKSDLAERRAAAVEGFGKVREANHLWDWSREERVWGLVQSALADLFELDDLADVGAEHESDDPRGGAKQSTKPKAPSGQPHEQDLLEFLDRKPYFGREDLGA